MWAGVHVCVCLWCVCMCAHVWVCVHVCGRVCPCVVVCACACVHMCVCVRAGMCMCVGGCAPEWACVHVCVCLCVCVCVCVCAGVCMRAGGCARVWACVLVWGDFEDTPPFLSPSHQMCGVAVCCVPGARGSVWACECQGCGVRPALHLVDMGSRVCSHVDHRPVLETVFCFSVFTQNDQNESSRHHSSEFNDLHTIV